MITHYHQTPIFYQSKGQGPALILLHGFLESSTMWEKVVASFQNNYQVICIDLPGHGKSGCFNEIHSMDAMADIVLQVLNELNVESATFIGHSMGGYVTMALLAKSPERVSKCVLLNTTTEADSAERKKNRNRAAKMLAENKESYVRLLMTKLYTPSANKKFASEIESQKREAIGFPTAGLQAAHLGMRDRLDTTSVLQQFKKEKFIITGVDDAIVPLKNINHISKKTNTPLFKVEGGHMLLTENWEKTCEVLHLVV